MKTMMEFRQAFEEMMKQRRGEGACTYEKPFILLSLSLPASQHALWDKLVFSFFPAKVLSDLAHFPFSLVNMLNKFHNSVSSPVSGCLLCLVPKVT